MNRIDRTLRVALLVSAATFLIAEVVTSFTTPALEAMPFWANLRLAFYVGMFAALGCVTLYVIDDAQRRRHSRLAATVERHDQVKRSAA